MQSVRYVSRILARTVLIVVLVSTPGLAGAPGVASLVASDEPGEPLVISGTVKDESGKPLTGATIRVFQADATGRYTVGKAMDERNARLAADIVTGEEGRYEIRTIRPGGYPGEIDVGDGEKRKLPGHIHFEIDAPGHARRRAQMVFSDDPRMTAHWIDWARKGRHPVVELERGEDGVLWGIHDWSLEKK